MALDEALMAHALQSGKCILRVYGWVRPTLSLGRNQVAVGKYDIARARTLGVDIIRRPTGGRAVLHFREITYSVVAPVDVLGDLRTSYDRINRILIGSLARLGVAAETSKPVERTPAPTALPCFDSPTAGEIVADGRKLVGSAQLREKGALLQHGSILVDDDQALADELALRPCGMVDRPATLRGLLGRAPTAAEVAGIMLIVLRQETGRDAWPLDTAAPLAEAENLRQKYESADWTWRR